MPTEIQEHIPTAPRPTAALSETSSIKLPHTQTADAVITVEDTEQSLRELLFDKIKLAVVAILFVLSVPLLLILFPIFIITVTQILIRMLILTVQYHRSKRVN